MKWLNDQSILEKGITVNELIIEGRYDLIFLDKNMTFLNIFSTFIKKSDFINKFPLRSMPYLSFPNTKKLLEYLSLLPDEYKINEYFLLRREFSRYMNTKSIILSNTFKNWFKTRRFPIIFFRVLDVLLPEKRDVLIKTLKSSSLTNYRGDKDFIFPFSLTEIFNPKMIYFVGCSFGDAGLHKELHYKISDGHTNPRKLKYAVKFLKKIHNIVQSFFIQDIPNKFRKIENRYEFIISSKWLCRFLNFVYGMPFSPKKILQIPKIIEFENPNIRENLYRMFLRGVFDTDGGINENNKSLIIKSASLNFIKEIKECLIKLNIQTSQIKEEKYRNSIVFSIWIYAHDIKNFAQKIGFSHPLKQQYLIKHLKSGCGDKTFIKMKENSLIHGYFNLGRISELSVYNIGHLIMKLRKTHNLSQEELASKIEIYRRTLGKYENNETGTTFKTLLKISNYFKISKINLYSMLLKENIKFGIKGGKPIALPIKYSESIVNLARYLVPAKDRVTVRKRYPGHILTFEEKIKLKDEVSNTFCTKISQSTKNDLVILNIALSRFLSEFFVYSPVWNSVNEEEITTLEKEWNSIWN
jgi:DNA-binding XRE family transcriptional regulator